MRQKLARVLGGVAIGALVISGTAACKADSGSEGSSGNSAACDLKIGFFGPLTGDAAGLGIHMRNGTKLAIDQYNKDNADCKVNLSEYDSQGDPAKAPALAQQAVGDTKVVGMIGPAFSGESEVADPIFEEAGLPIITPSATRPSLSTKGWKIFHRGVGNDTSQGPAAGRYIKNVLKSDKVYVVDDQSAYGAGLVDEVKKVLGTVAGEDKVQVKQTNFSAVVTKIVGSGANVLFFGGYYTEAGLLLKQLKGAGWKGTMVAGDGVNDANFVKVAGQQVAEGTVLTCPCAPATAAKGTFVTDYKAAFENAEPGTYADVSYDITKIFLEGIKSGKASRADLLAFVKSYNKAGGATGVTYKFEPTGELDPAQVLVWAFKVNAGQVVPDIEIPKA
ncbi:MULTISPECIES: branched-chain amino acid ABC transporter substrate-binding protein [Micromonospora]|uniref:Branched-chain amino acid transport system substrate-binding protein n=1 Tax=Micromonospora rifamycinica TaxID=291594 RepID=A0A120F9K8_9ACTN|nr:MULTISPECIES: branched-chain amino acid ABC transporter substrate-binding protein [Micromonospora]KWV33515.1 branched chain amino acid ABC transporter substrate-binding protein [Micromonospora rifamycinica]WFE66950.1 branched-chain amino acid ABC transporter substrate-binding protein [Micromonospora sp. WMMD714]SCG81166.1 branched-chain amino acid transport system substrate-binding protein [Micromonospora rifamycinica]